MAGITHDKERVSLNLAKLKKENQNFEVVIDSDAAVAFKEGKDIDIRDIVKSHEIFSDAQKGNVAPENIMKNIFNTTNTLEVAKIIIKEGEIQLTAEYRQQLREKKKKQIIEIIHKYGVDPRTHAPHPTLRIENAIEEAKVKIDEFKNVDEQVQDILSKLRPILPIKFEIKEIAVKIPGDYAGKSSPIVYKFGKVLREEWQRDGSWVCVVELPAGLEEELYDQLNNLTHGNVESKVLKTK